MSEMQADLNRMRKQHDEQNYTSLNEVGLAQGRICAVDRFIKRIFASDRVVELSELQNLSKEEDDSEES